MNRDGRNEALKAGTIGVVSTTRWGGRANFIIIEFEGRLLAVYEERRGLRVNAIDAKKIRKIFEGERRAEVGRGIESKLYRGLHSLDEEEVGALLDALASVSYMQGEVEDDDLEEDE